MLADEYVLTHKVQGEAGRRASSGSHQRSLAGEISSNSLPKNGNKQDANWTCNYCLGKGHWKADCPVLRAKNKFHFGH